MGLLLLIPLLLPAQKIVKINLQSAGSLAYSKVMGEDLRRVIGDVVFEHDGAHLYCDSAYFFELSNSLEAFGHIRIRVSDTLNIYGDRLKYDGNTRIADLLGKVKLVDRQTTLTTDRLIYDRKTEMAYYTTGGRITGSENTLTSRTGYYYTAAKNFFFRGNVRLVNPRYTMNSDTLLYNTLSRVAWFQGPTTIVSKENTIYCENGWYNTVTDRSQFNKNAYLRNAGRQLGGDSLSYDRVKGFGQAFANVSLSDTARDIFVNGDHGIYREKEGLAIITGKAVAMLAEESDTLYLHADTLRVTFDSLQNTRAVFAYYASRFFRTNLQGMSDSLVYLLSDSTITLFRDPVIWSEGNQLTADSIRLWLTNRQADSMMLYNTAFIISAADSGQFNQVRGKNMLGYFRDNEIYKVNVQSNAESIYFVDEDDGSRIGTNFAAAGELVIYLKDRKIHRIVYAGQPAAKLKTENDTGPGELLLKGFLWKESERPKSRQDIFRR